METTFSPQEVLTIAVHVEESGEKLYGMLQEKAADSQLKEMWRYLKEAEIKHRQIFGEMLEKAGEYVVPEVVPGEYHAYIKAIASEYVFAPARIDKKILEGFESDSDALEFGILIEKESILVYSAVQEYIAADKKSVLQAIIDEEKRHVVDLSFMKSQLKSNT